MTRLMKDSGIEWIGEIPENWQMLRMKSCIAQRDGGAWGEEATGEDGDTICLRIADFDYARFRFKDTETDALTMRHYDTDVIQKLLLEENDILIEKSGGGEKTPVGRTVIFDKTYPALFANFMDRLRCATFVYPPFMQYLFVTFYKNDYTRNYIKQTTGIQNLDLTSMLANEKVAMPPMGEQHRIAAFLDRRCAEIDAVIERTKATIEEYKKLKQAVITEAVTKGVRGARKMKYSGIEWIGEIPEEWEVRKLGRFINIRSGITLGKTYPQDAELVEMPYLRVANVKADGFALDDVATIEVTPEEAEKYALKAGELLMTEGGDRDKLGRGTIWHGEISPCLHQNHVFAATCDETWLLTQYLAYITASNVGRQYFDITAKKTTNLACTNSNTILQFKIPLPSTEEQREIIEWLPIRCSSLDTLIAKKTTLLTELETYKKSLIYEYVTGKKEAPSSV